MQRLLELATPILALLGFISLLRIGYSSLVSETQETLPDRLQVHDFDYSATLSTYLGAPLLEGNSVEHLRNGDEIFPSMLKAIREAQTTINFLTYVYWSGDIAQEFATDLAAAAQRGVEVRILLDAMGAAAIPAELLERMREGGCEVEWFHPVRWYNLRRLNRRTHRKVLVTDGRVAFTGGVGVADEWTGDARDENEWRDDHFRITGPAALALQGAFADNWRNATGEILTGRHMVASLAGVGQARVVPFFSSPPHDISPIAFAYWLGAQRAQHRLDIITPYFLPDQSLVDTLVETAQRGVQVRLLMPGDHNDSAMVRWASLTRYPDLLAAKIEILEYQPTMLHSKVVLIDDEWSIIGSANFDNRSFELNDEIALLVESRDLNTELSESLDRDLARSQRIDPEEFEAIPMWKKVLGGLLLSVREQL